MRELFYTVDIDSITPSTIMDAGFQCEYNATAVVFTLTDRLVTALGNEQGQPSWAVEAINAEGLVSIYPITFTENTARFVLPTALTVPGTTVTLQPALSLLDDNFELLKKLYYPSARVRFGQSVTGILMGGEEYDRYARNLVGAMKVAVSAAQVASDSVSEATDAAHLALDAANRAEAAAAEESWIHLKTVTLDAAKYDPNEKTEDMGDTTKGLRVKVTLPANTVLPNNRLVAYISLNNGRQIVVRAEGWAKDESNPTVCIYEVRPFADVWNAETAPYFKTIASVTGDVTRKQGDSVRYFKLMTNVDNPLPVGTKMEFWGLE